jgi:hypothetical protein
LFPFFNKAVKAVSSLQQEASDIRPSVKWLAVCVGGYSRVALPSPACRRARTHLIVRRHAVQLRN